MLLASFADLWNYRELLRRLIRRNLSVRYQRSALGFLWALLNPLLTIILLVGVFGYIIRIGVPSYWAFLLSGYFAWVFILHTLSTSIGVLSEHASMIKGVAFPVEILVYAQAISRLIEFAAELFLVVVALCAFHHHAVPASVLLLPVLMVIQLLLVLGLALPAASLAVFYRDFQHAVPVALSIIAYVSPVYYPASMVPASLQRLYGFNPLSSLMTLYHRVLYDGQFPAPMELVVAALIALVVFGAGITVFRRQQALIAELL